MNFSFAEHITEADLKLLRIHACMFQRFARHYFSYSDIASQEVADLLAEDTLDIYSEASCEAGADDEDPSAQVPRKTGKRRKNETEARPACKQPAKEEVTTSPVDPPFPFAPPQLAPEVKQAKDVHRVTSDDA